MTKQNRKNIIKMTLELIQYLVSGFKGVGGYLKKKKEGSSGKLMPGEREWKTNENKILQKGNLLKHTTTQQIRFI